MNENLGAIVGGLVAVALIGAVASCEVASRKMCNEAKIAAIAAGDGSLAASIRCGTGTW